MWRHLMDIMESSALCWTILSGLFPKKAAAFASEQNTKWHNPSH